MNRLQDKCTYDRVLNQYNRHSTLMSAYKNIKDENFKYYILKQKADVFHAMKSFFKNETGEKMA